MGYTYILVIWTVVAAAGDRHGIVARDMDWRPIGEFHLEQGRIGKDYKTAKEMCEDAAKELGLKAGRWRCIRSK